MQAADPPRSLAPEEAHDHFAAIVEFSDDAILSKDRHGVILSWNPAAERMYGYSAEEAVGQPISILIPEHRVGEEHMILDRVLRGDRVDHYETDRVTKDGRIITVSLTVSPIRDADGAVNSASVIARDITRRHRSLLLAAKLQEITSELSRELASSRIIDVALHQITAALRAQAAAIGLVDQDEIELVGSAGHSEAGLAAWRRFPISDAVPMGYAVVTGEPVWATSPDVLRERFPGLRDASIRFVSLAVLPLASPGAAFGALSVSFDEPRELDPEERAFLVAATQQAAYALERARLFEAERLVAERQTFLAEAGALLAESLDPESALERLASLAVHHVADWCGVELVNDDGSLRNVAVAHADESRTGLARELRERYPVDPNAETGVPNVIRTGTSELYSEVTDEMLAAVAEDEEHLRLLRGLGIRSVMIAPLTARGRVFGAISFVASGPDRRYGEDDLTFAEDLARRAALGIDNAMLFMREHEAAVTLQRSLLPESLPPDRDGIQFDARYRPAAPGLEVGGDWYEVVIAGRGHVVATIGDVAGRGIRAASAMGRLRPALRAYVLDGHGPSEAVRRLDRLMKEQDRAEMTTLFHLQYDPETRRAVYVRAGHPPALMRLADGTVVELAGTGTPPLGILDDVDFPEHAVEIPAGSLLLLYTDGLIERREVNLAEGLARLKEAFTEAPSGAADCLAWLERRLEPDAIPDDVAMLAVSTAP